jgi:hypothetical protein
MKLIVQISGEIEQFIIDNRIPILKRGNSSLTLEVTRSQHLELLDPKFSWRFPNLEELTKLGEEENKSCLQD